MEVVIPNTVTTIGYSAFARCKGLKVIYIPASVVVIEEAKTPNPFCGCRGITEIIVDEKNPVFDSRNNCNAIIETATNTLITGCQTSTIPDGVIRIKDDAFYRCRDTGITVPSSVSEIGEYSFEDVPWLVYDGIAAGYPWGALEVRRSDGAILFPSKEDISGISKLKNR